MNICRHNHFEHCTILYLRVQNVTYEIINLKDNYYYYNELFEYNINVAQNHFSK